MKRSSSASTTVRRGRGGTTASSTFLRFPRYSELNHPIFASAELPYEITVMPVSFKVLKDGSLRAEMVLVVPSDGVKKIVVGKRGAAIKQVGTGARLELQKLWDAKVHLFLSVKVAKS